MDGRKARPATERAGHGGSEIGGWMEGDRRPACRDEGRVIRASMPARIFGIAAGLFGGFGTALAAAASHGADPRGIAIAAAMLLVHAPTLLALAALRELAPRVLGLAGAALAGGVAIFAADLAARHYLGTRLFPGAAPLGGSLAIAGWAGIVLGFLVARRP